MTKILTKIKELKKQTDNDLKAYVCNYIIDDYKTDDDIKIFFKDLFNHGCVSGMVGGLVYYKDTKEFFIDFMDEIDEIVNEFQDSTGEPIKFDTPTYNSKAWFGFEEMARNINNELEIIDF